MPWTMEQVELETQIEKKYSGYITRQKTNAGKQKKVMIGRELFDAKRYEGSVRG